MKVYNLSPLLILSILSFSPLFIQADNLSDSINKTVVATKEMKAKFQESLPAVMKMEKNKVLAELYQANRDSILKQGFTESDAANLTLELFHISSDRGDYKFNSTVTFKRNCDQIPMCAYEEVTLSIEGVAMFVSSTEKLGYIIPLNTKSSFHRIFNKGNSSGGGVK